MPRVFGVRIRTPRCPDVTGSRAKTGPESESGPASKQAPRFRPQDLTRHASTGGVSYLTALPESVLSRTGSRMSTGCRPRTHDSSRGATVSSRLTQPTRPVSMSRLHTKMQRAHHARGRSERTKRRTRTQTERRSGRRAPRRACQTRHMPMSVHAHVLFSSKVIALPCTTPRKENARARLLNAGASELGSLLQTSREQGALSVVA